MSNYQIFISYRRDGAEHFAARLQDKLSAMGYNVFFDIESMRAGLFNEQIYQAIDACKDVILVLPPNGLDRCANEDDWVRKEIEYSIQQKKNILPITLEGFVFPKEAPESIKEILNYEATDFRPHYFDAMMQRIVSMLQSAPVAPSTPKSDCIENGIRFLKIGMYPKAKECFETAIAEDLSNPEAYFYAAIAMLEGKRPFLAPKATIGNIENYLNAAIAYENKAIYHYYMAYIKYDFYAKKMLRTSPTYQEHLSQAYALNVSNAAIHDLFELLKLEKPESF